MHKAEQIGMQLISSILMVDSIVLTLTWGVMGFSNVSEENKKLFLSILPIGWVFLLISLFTGIICFQFMVTKARKESANVMAERTVEISFCLCWFSFLIGMLFYLVTILKLIRG